jgi:hypothetical protein
MDIDMQHCYEHAACAEKRSMDMKLDMPHVRNLSITMQHVPAHAARLGLNGVSTSILQVHAHDESPCSCCMSISMLHVSCRCCVTMSLMHVHVHTASLCICCMSTSMLHVHVHVARLLRRPIRQFMVNPLN